MRGRVWFWATLALSSLSIVAVVLGLAELIESRFFSHLDYVTLHYLYVSRGIVSSLLLAFWAGWFVLRERRLTEEELRRSREHYRRLLEASPAAVALYDAGLRVVEWNAAAERLYGFTKQEVIGAPLPTVPPEQQDELRAWLRQVAEGRSVLEMETLRSDRRGAAVEVQLSLLPFEDTSGNPQFLEVTEDIRERVRLRQKLLEIGKLASMGQMAAGTAHHLNTPLAAMLLRVQMMRARTRQAPAEADLERLEAGIRTCRHFVQRLLEFSRPTPVEKRPEDVVALLRSAASFLAPAVQAKRARLSFEIEAADGTLVLADRNLLEALFTTLLSNALDAISEGGSIRVQCGAGQSGRVEIRIADDGCGVAPEVLPHVFEPFFTTKGSDQGTGLGLAIARNIVSQHGGAVRLESETGSGATAVIELPLYHPAPEPVSGGRS